jgi:acetyl-CoA C-acetyltransferase
VKNRAHARLNPFARMRDDELTFDLACTTSDIDLPIATPLKVSDCSQITDGAAAVVLCSKHFIEKVQPRGSVRLIGFAHTTDYLSLKEKDASDFPIARKAAEQAYAMAGIGPGDIDGAEVQRLLLNLGNRAIRNPRLRRARRGRAVH